MIKITQEEFIERAKKVHNNKYDYSKIEYANNKTKICIICPEHGEFWQTPDVHLRGCGCPYCGKTKKLTNEEFIERAKKVHNNKYDYSKTEYKNARTKVCIICPEHGEFWQTPINHLNDQGCYRCKGAKTFDLRDFILKAHNIHGDKYDYSNVNYVDSKTKVCIICPEHGEFWQVPYYHLSGNGCPKCGRKNIWDKRGRITTEEFVKKAKEIHGDKYDYSDAHYENSKTKIKIICHKHYKNGIEHGSFWQTPHAHLNGNGCPHCRNSQLESKIFKLLIESNIEFEKEKTYDWLYNNGHMYLDFYLPEYNIGIECQGIQHYIDMEICGRKNYKYVHENDLLKNKLCKENGIKIFYFTNRSIYENYCKNKELTFYDFNSMINTIKNECKT